MPPQLQRRNCTRTFGRQAGCAEDFDDQAGADSFWGLNLETAALMVQHLINDRGSTGKLDVSRAGNDFGDADSLGCTSVQEGVPQTRQCAADNTQPKPATTMTPTATGTTLLNS
jgi:hypothetical protein